MFITTQNRGGSGGSGGRVVPQPGYIQRRVEEHKLMKQLETERETSTARHGTARQCEALSGGQDEDGDVCHMRRKTQK